uniref:RAB, member of RAS oncogene family-like 2 n=1 Tax=Salarias fasciatus TaxID=181472 RepID=A0A672GLC2_SALFA
MAGDAGSIPELDQKKYDGDQQVKIICLGDSAVGKSNLKSCCSRPQQLSTYALTLYKHTATVGSMTVSIGVTQRSFNFAKKQGLPFYFVSAADGTNVVKMFRETIKRAVDYKQNPSDFMDEVMQELENFDLEKKQEDLEADEDGLKAESPELG